MKIIAFASSNSSKSINKEFVKYAAGFFDTYEPEILDLKDFELPLFGVDLEARIGVPDAARAFAEKIDEADLLIISLAEHNGAYTAAFKNLFDWISRIKGRKAFGDKPMFLMAVSDGGRGGKSVLGIALNRMPYSGGKVISNYSFPKYYDNFIPGTGITDPELLDQFKLAVDEVKKFISENFN